MPPSTDLTPLWSALRTLLVLLGTCLAGKGLGDTGLYFWVEFLAGSIMILGPAVWGVWAALDNILHKKPAAVMAGINLALSGNLKVDPSGAPKPVTPETATHIINIYGKQ